MRFELTVLETSTLDFESYAQYVRAPLSRAHQRLLVARTVRIKRLFAHRVADFYPNYCEAARCRTNSDVFLKSVFSTMGAMRNCRLQLRTSTNGFLPREE